MIKYLHFLIMPIFLSLSAGAMAAPQPIELLRAVERAEKARPGQVLDVELERDRRGRLVYQIDVADGGALHEVCVDARSGAVIEISRQRLEGWYRNLFGAVFSRLSNARPLSAIIRNLQARTGGTVISVDFDTEGGQARYEMELSTAAGIAGLYIEPKTGQRLDFVVDD